MRIIREEDPLYVQMNLKAALFAYIDARSFVNKRILDFGCGGGASTIILARMFPNTQIVGIDLDRGLLSIAKFRSKYYSLNNVEFNLSPSGVQLPTQMGCFDFVILSAVFEHLLPKERELIIHQIWSVVKPGGILFLNQTPHRYFPIEVHTTGLPLINYLPDKVTHVLACRLSKRVKCEESWEVLLRRGIRGGTEREIIRILSEKCNDNPIILKPNRLGLHDAIDFWYKISSSSRLSAAKQLLKFVLKTIKFISGTTFVPYLSLAIAKRNVH